MKIGMKLYCVAAEGVGWHLEERVVTSVVQDQFLMEGCAVYVTQAVVGCSLFPTPAAACTHFANLQRKRLGSANREVAAAKKAISWATGSLATIRAASKAIRRMAVR